MLLAGQGGDHLTSSMIYHSITVTCIPNTLVGEIACFTNSITAGGNIQTDGGANKYIKATGFISNQIGQLSDFGVTDAGFYILPAGGLQFVGGGCGRMTLTSCGYLGIGTCTPTAPLYVLGNVLGSVVTRIQNSNICGYSSTTFMNSAGTGVAHVGYGNTGVGAPLACTAFFGTIAASDAVITTSDLVRLKIASTGEACFAFRVCSPALTTPNIRLSDETTFGATWCKGSGGYPFMFADGGQSLGFGNSEAASPTSERFKIFQNGIACFACELTAKTIGTNDLILNNLNYECANYVDGTRGSWLIQEGASDLFIINQVSCKKYKFNLIEIK
jgi:hypothetical protein